MNHKGKVIIVEGENSAIGSTTFLKFMEQAAQHKT